MIIPVPSHKNRFQIRLKLQAFTPTTIGVKAYDATRKNTYYLKRKVPFYVKDFKNGTCVKALTLSFPISPELLTLKIEDKQNEDDYDFEVLDFNVEAMPESKVWAAESMHDFIAFSEQFCQKAGYLKSGFYHSKDYQFLIHYLPQITGPLGEPMATPARTHRITGRHQVSQALFQRFSIPIRLFIMLHERQHFALPTRQEKPADLAALKLYLDLGYPTIEAVYAATKVFGMHKTTIGQAQLTRTQDIITFINRYQAQP